jgi:hypothetical protein
LIARLISTDEEDRMPPAKSNKHLSAEQIETLRRWIAEGAEYQSHWAFSPPQRAPLPEVRAASRPRAPIDRFVLARLEREGLAPSPEATPRPGCAASASISSACRPPPPTAPRSSTMSPGAARPPTARPSTACSPRHTSANASPSTWLDAARYADSHGFNDDSTRTMWRWRDWVIEAFNRNLPYNTFVTEQLAGDLLPSPTLEQRIATGFGRNHVINSEGGIDRRGIPRRIRRRPCAHPQHRLAGPDLRMRPLPRSANSTRSRSATTSASSPSSTMCPSSARMAASPTPCQ